MPTRHVDKKKAQKRDMEQQLVSKRALFIKVLELKFQAIPFQYHQKIKTASLSELITWAGKIETANTLNDVFS